MANDTIKKISVFGTVQGVGMRPFVYRLAVSLGLFGSVQNNSAGVIIMAGGPPDKIDEFVARISSDCPPLARIAKVICEEAKPCCLDAATEKALGKGEFVIIQSASQGYASAHIPPDIAPCEDCAREMNDPSDRRSKYPFINCTNCGPRFSIIKSVPYDRPATTMADFKMCPQCMAEYEDPMNRRFHAQPNACEKCGPKAMLFIGVKREFEDSEAIAHTAKLIKLGKIVAIKGVGGYHLACDASLDFAVAKLREKKLRDEKPFAVMVESLETARTICNISKEEESLILTPERPIVLLEKKPACLVSELVAPKNQNLGLMLTSSPLHALVLREAGALGVKALVMTSGNLSDEPIVCKDDEALSLFAGIADAVLTHDRNIHARLDDSIARVVAGDVSVMRRSRGFVPAPIYSSQSLTESFAVGADLKGAVAAAKNNFVFLSQHLGDLGNPATANFMEEASSHVLRLFDVAPQIVICDLHPDYFSTRFAARLAKEFGAKLCKVQHHYAHIASVMAEHDIAGDLVLGIAMDGTGLGTDGTIWGGEFLLCKGREFTRLAHLSQVPLPGGDLAAKSPWRMALSYLNAAGIDASEVPSHAYRREADILLQMIKNGINSPMTSSCGRLFDAVADLAGICSHNSFEGQAAIMLEQAAHSLDALAYEYDIGTASQGLLEINFFPTIRAIAKDSRKRIGADEISSRFHATVVMAFVDCALKVIKRAAANGRKIPDKVCLSGGCFQNKILLEGVKKGLEEAGLRVYTNRLVPPNDGGIALGQIFAAAVKEKA